MSGKTGPILTTATMTVNVTLAAAALQLSAADVTSLFRDGVMAQGFAERWAARCFGFTARESRNRPSAERVMVLTVDGLSFLPSSAKGMGRSGGLSDAITYLHSLNRLFVADLSRFPDVLFWELNRPYLIQQVERGGLGTSLSREKFLKLAQQPALFPEQDLVQR